jgi:hypothetical protein
MERRSGEDVERSGWDMEKRSGEDVERRSGYTVE